MRTDDDITVIEDCLVRLRLAGWSIGAAPHYGLGGDLSWVVTGEHGEARIRAEAATRTSA